MTRIVSFPATVRPSPLAVERFSAPAPSLQQGSISQEAALLASYGRPDRDNRAIVRILEEAAARVPDLPRLSFHPSEEGVSIFWHQGGGRQLDLYAPYLGVLDAAGLCRVIGRSIGGRSRGSMDEDFDCGERAFLEKRALPAITGAKILEMRQSRNNTIDFVIKCLGIGLRGHEFGLVLDLILRHLKERVDFDGLIRIACLGFDIDLGVLNSSLEYIRGPIYSAVVRHGFEGRVEVSYNYFFGDLTDPLSCPPMLAFGYPDFTIWRRTHVLANELISFARGREIVAGIRQSLNRPGALVVHENGVRNNHLWLQELVT